MAAIDLTGILRMPGELIVNVTDLTIAAPYGGTRLGLVQDLVVEIEQGAVEIRTEEFGVEVVEVVDGNRAWRLAAALRSYDRDAINAVFPSTLSGSETAQRVITDGTDARAGRRGSARAVPLLFAPDDPQRRPAILLHRAIPFPAAAAELTLDLDQEAMIGVVFRAIRHVTNNRLVSLGLIADIAGRL